MLPATANLQMSSSFMESSSPMGPDTQVILVLVLGLRPSDFSPATLEVLSSSQPSVQVHWGLPDKRKRSQPEEKDLYDVVLVDCRNVPEAEYLLREFEISGGEPLFVGVRDEQLGDNTNLQWLEKKGAYLTDLSSASSTLQCAVFYAKEKKRLLGERDRLRRQVEEASYKNEMGDVASTVLHNVGNVLTSVMVAANLVETIIEQSSVTLVPRMAGLLKQHEGQLSSFLTENPKGQRILPSLEKLGAHLNQEQQKVLQEIQGLVRNVDHVKQIISSHQLMAKGAGQVEPILLTDLVNHALTLSLQPGDESWITVRREYQNIPPFLGEKHQILQILVNLLRNAKQAMRQFTREEGHVLTLGVDGDLKKEKFVVVTVQDTGVGLSSEQLSKLFTRGFTTKDDGNGIGLHSSAQALRNMGGTLEVCSEGVGLGACFQLSIPIREKTL